MTGLAEPVTKEAPRITDELVAQIQDLLPQAFTEGKVDPDKLRAALGDLVDNAPERYTFTWAGRRDAVRLAQTPTRSTLVPCREESVRFDDTQHLFLEGDNLEVLKLLSKPYAGRVKMIYIDPPYNTGNDLVYRDDYADPLATYLRRTEQADAEGNLLTDDPETGGRYHSAWLSMMYPRLLLARQLLRDDGVIFVSIDDCEVHNLRLIMNEIFGEENFLATFVWKRRSGAMYAVNNISSDHEYVLCYARSTTALSGVPRTFARYDNPDDDPRGPWVADNLSAAKPGGNTHYPITDPETGYEYWPPKGRYWPYNPEVMAQKIAEGRILFPGTPDGSPLLKRFQREARSLFRPVSTWIASPSDDDEGREGVTTLRASINTQGTREIKALFEDKVFSYPKPVSLLKALVDQGTTESGDIVLDFFAGSCTTAQAVLELNREDGKARRFIMVQLPEPTPADSAAHAAGLATIADIGKERIRRVIDRMNEETAGQLPLGLGAPEDRGFRVFRLAPSHFQLLAGTADDEPDAHASQLSFRTDPLAPAWQPDSVIYEIAVREGLGLNSQIATVGAHGHAPATFYRVTDPDRDQSLIICLDDTLSPDAVQALSLSKEDLFICRDAALTSDLAADLALQCRLKTIGEQTITDSALDRLDK